MRDDPLRRQLLAELRALRRGAGVRQGSDVANSEALVRVVGMGSAEQAFATLVDMLRHHGAEPEGDIRAYLETCGLVSEGNSLNQRLDSYAATHFVDRRTALRRSDRGAEKLATIFRDETLFFRPWGHITIFQTGPMVLPTVALHMDPESEYREPAVWVNDELLDVTFEFQDPEPTTGYVRAGWHLAGALLRSDRPWLFKLDVEWRMGVWPQWVLGAQLADNRLVAKIQTQRNFMTEATVTWGAWPGQDVPRDAPFLSFPLPPGMTADTAEAASAVYDEE